MEKEDVMKCVKSCLVLNKGSTTLTDLKRDFCELEGKEIPYKEFGYDTLQAFLVDIPGVTSCGLDGGVPTFTVNDDKIQHIKDMVESQKARSNSRKKKGYRSENSYGYTGRNYNLDCNYGRSSKHYFDIVKRFNDHFDDKYQECEPSQQKPSSKLPEPDCQSSPRREKRQQNGYSNKPDFNNGVPPRQQSRQYDTWSGTEFLPSQESRCPHEEPGTGTKQESGYHEEPRTGSRTDFPPWQENSHHEEEYFETESFRRSSGGGSQNGYEPTFDDSFSSRNPQRPQPTNHHHDEPSFDTGLLLPSTTEFPKKQQTRHRSFDTAACLPSKSESRPNDHPSKPTFEHGFPPKGLAKRGQETSYPEVQSFDEARPPSKGSFPNNQLFDDARPRSKSSYHEEQSFDDTKPPSKVSFPNDQLFDDARPRSKSSYHEEQSFDDTKRPSKSSFHNDQLFDDARPQKSSYHDEQSFDDARPPSKSRYHVKQLSDDAGPSSKGSYHDEQLFDDSKPPSKSRYHSKQPFHDVGPSSKGSYHDEQSFDDSRPPSKSRYHSKQPFHDVTSSNSRERRQNDSIVLPKGPREVGETNSVYHEVPPYDTGLLIPSKYPNYGEMHQDVYSNEPSYANGCSHNGPTSKFNYDLSKPETTSEYSGKKLILLNPTKKFTSANPPHGFTQPPPNLCKPPPGYSQDYLIEALNQELNDMTLKQQLTANVADFIQNFQTCQPDPEKVKQVLLSPTSSENSVRSTKVANDSIKVTVQNNMCPAKQPAQRKVPNRRNLPNATLFGRQLIGDDFLLSLSFMQMGYELSSMPYPWDLCISGMTITECLKQLRNTRKLRPGVILLIGAMDILSGVSLEKMKLSMQILLRELCGRVGSVVLLTTPLLTLHACFEEFWTKQIAYNSWLKQQHGKSCVQVVDIWDIFVDQDDILSHLFFNESCIPDKMADSVILWNKAGIAKVVETIKIAIFS